MTSRGRSRARRVLGVIGGVVGVTVTFVTATAAGVVLHLDVPATRRLVMTQVNGVLEKQLKGDVKIEALTGLGLRGIDGARVRVKDPDGVQVLYADGVKIRVRALQAARSALFGKGDIHVAVPLVSIDHADVALDADPMGALRIARAFEPKPTNEPEPPPKKGGRGVFVDAPDVVLKHAWAHGVMSEGAPPIDADVKDLAGFARIDSAETRAEIDRVELVSRGMPMGADPSGKLTGKLRLPATKEGEDPAMPDVDATFDGTIMGATTGIVAKMRGDTFDATVEAHANSGARIGEALGELPLRDELTLRVEAHGTLPKVNAIAHVALGEATVDADADIDIENETSIATKVSARKIDLSAILNGAPKSDLGLDATASATLGPTIRAKASVDTLPGTIDRERVPRVVMRGEMDGDVAHATAKIYEPSMPTDVRVSMKPENGDRIVDAHVRAQIPDLRRVPKLSAAIEKGSAQVVGDARVALNAKTFDAKVAVSGRRVLSGTQSVNKVRAEAKAHGALDKPVIDAAVYAEEVRAAGFDARLVEARSRVEVGPEIVLRDPRVDITRDAGKVSVAAGRVVARGANVRVEGAVIEGLGDPIRAEVSRDAQKTVVKLAAPRVDLVQASKFAGQDLGITSGTLGIGADVTLTANDAQGVVKAKLDHFTMKKIENAGLELETRLEGRELELHVDAALAQAGRLSLHSKRITLAGNPMAPASWKGASGRVALEGDLDLAKVSSLVPHESMPLGELRGELVVSGALGRDNPESPPEVRLHAHTIGLVAAGKTPAEDAIPKRPREVEVIGVSPWRSDDVDIGVDVRNDATSGFTSVAARVTDKKGIVVAFDAKSDLPYAELMADAGAAKAKLLHVPVSARVIVPKRSLDAMPAVLGVKNMSGSVEAQIDVGGTPLEPAVAVVARGRELRTSAVSMDMAADADIGLTYDGKVADLAVKVATEKREVLSIATHVDAKARDFLEAAPGQTPDWGATTKVALASFPLETVGPLADRQIKGRVSGEAAIDGLNRDARMYAHLAFEKLTIGRATYETAKVDVDAGRGRLTAKARFEQKDGFADLSAATGIVWGKEIAPKLREDQPIEARLQAKGFRAAAIQPFVEGTMNQLDGRIDADASATLLPGRNEAKLDGTIAIRDGVMQLSAIGEEFRDLRANVTLRPDGNIEVRDVFARSIEGEIKASANVKLRGLGLENADANVSIPKQHPLDLAIDGQPLGEVWGDVKMSAKTSDDGKKLALVVDVPRFEVELPQTMKAGVQELDENPKIRVGVYRDPHTLVKLPLDKEDFEKNEVAQQKLAAQTDGKRTDVDIRLGRISVKRGNTGEAVLSGNPKVTIDGGETVITGQIRVDSGWADVQGKKFDIEKGTVTFNGETPPNPVVVATATWKAQDDTQVYAEFVGPVKTGKVTLRSEPPRPKSELLSLVLFGTSDGANPTPPPQGAQQNGTQKAAMGIGGGFAAQGLTEALDDLAGINATARIDTTSSRNPRPEVEFQVSNRVSVAFSHVIGQPPVTEPPDKNMARIEWRFRANWAFESTTGDRGRQLFDLIWSRRY